MKRIYLLFLLTLLFSACQKPVEQLEGLRLADGQSSEIVFDGFASTPSISFVSDYVWMIGIEEECDWFEVRLAKLPLKFQFLIILQELMLNL